MYKVKLLNKKTLFVVLSIILLYISILPFEHSTIKLLDDIVPLAFGVIWIFHFINHPISSTETHIFILLIFITVVGILSNIFSNISVRFSHIIFDIFSFWKLYFMVLGTKALFNNRKDSLCSTLHYLAVLSEIFLCVSFIFGILHLLGKVNMVESDMRYGFKPFMFIFKNASQFGVLLGVSLAFVLYDNCKNHLIYELMGIFTMILTLKGMSLIIVAVYVFLNILQVKKIKIWQLSLAGVVLVFVLRYQIYRYLLDETAPRAMLIKYGIVTAMNNFPFGAGFATYGSEMAARHYSPLYVLYGFTARKSLLYGETTALNDAYIAMGFGEFGFLGALALLLILALLGLKVLKIRSQNKRAIYISLALYACICGMAVMAGSIKVGPGQLMLFSIEAFILKSKFENNQTSKKEMYRI